MVLSGSTKKTISATSVSDLKRHIDLDLVSIVSRFSRENRFCLLDLLLFPFFLFKSLRRRLEVLADELPKLQVELQLALELVLDIIALNFLSSGGFSLYQFHRFSCVSRHLDHI
eukprot:Skav202852  [mRNA]  locus=scaffold2311:124475:126519:- [translate_table: standard]